MTNYHRGIQTYKQKEKYSSLKPVNPFLEQCRQLTLCHSMGTYNLNDDLLILSSRLTIVYICFIVFPQYVLELHLG